MAREEHPGRLRNQFRLTILLSPEAGMRALSIDVPEERFNMEVVLQPLAFVTFKGK
jgi:hypothetical protein